LKKNPTTGKYEIKKPELGECSKRDKFEPMEKIDEDVAEFEQLVEMIDELNQ